MRVGLVHNERPWRLPVLRHDSGCIWVVPLGPWKLVICEAYTRIRAAIDYLALLLGSILGTVLWVTS